MSAARAGCVEEVKFLIKKGANINHISWGKKDPKDKTGYTPLANAARGQFNRLEIAKLLLAEGAKPNTIVGGDKTALDLAIDWDYEIVAKLLRKHGAKTFAELEAK